MRLAQSIHDHQVEDRAMLMGREPVPCRANMWRTVSSHPSRSQFGRPSLRAARIDRAIHPHHYQVTLFISFIMRLFSPRSDRCRAPTPTVCVRFAKEFARKVSWSALLWRAVCHGRQPVVVAHHIIREPTFFQRYTLACNFLSRRTN